MIACFFIFPPFLKRILEVPFRHPFQLLLYMPKWILRKELLQPFSLTHGGPAVVAFIALIAKGGETT